MLHPGIIASIVILCAILITMIILIIVYWYKVKLLFKPEKYSFTDFLNNDSTRKLLINKLGINKIVSSKQDFNNYMSSAKNHMNDKNLHSEVNRNIEVGECVTLPRVIVKDKDIYNSKTIEYKGITYLRLIDGIDINLTGDLYKEFRDKYGLEDNTTYTIRIENDMGIASGKENTFDKKELIISFIKNYNGYFKQDNVDDAIATDIDLKNILETKKKDNKNTVNSLYNKGAYGTYFLTRGQSKNIDLPKLFDENGKSKYFVSTEKGVLEDEKIRYKLNLDSVNNYFDKGFVNLYIVLSRGIDGSDNIIRYM